MEDLLFPARQIARQLRQLETAPTLCFGMFLLLVLAVLLFEASLIQPAVVGALFAVFGWFVAMISFAKSCRRKPGWGIVLAAFHAYALLMSVGSLGVVIVGSYLVSGLVTTSKCLSAGRGTAVAILQVVLSIVLLIGIVVVICWLYRRLRSILHPMQREVAVELARVELKRQRR